MEHAEGTHSASGRIIGSQVLNLGCGRKHASGAINLDITSETSPDVVHDLNKTPWPFPDNNFREVLAFDVIEHLGDIVKTMEEIHRICQPQAVVKITVPHFSCANAFTDPTHRHYFGFFSFDYFTGEHEFSFYSKVRFRTQNRIMVFKPTLINKVIWRLARRFPFQYEQRWAWIFPAWFLYFELEVIKCG
jgi:SAM-dependent methyltransferase